MKNIVYIVLISVFFIGCADKDKIVVPSYTTSSKQEIYKDKVILVDINDQRKNTMVSTIYNDGEIKEQYPLNNDVKLWYRYGLERELKNKGLYSEDIFAKAKVVVNIKKIEASYDQYSLAKDNMKMNLVLELVIRIDDKTITSKININQTVFKTLVLDASDFEDIVSEAMNTSIQRAVAIISAKLNTKE